MLRQPSWDVMALQPAVPRKCQIPSTKPGTRQRSFHHQQGDAPQKSCKWPRPSWWFTLQVGCISDLLLSDDHYKATMWNPLCFWEMNLPTQLLLSASICVWVYRLYRLSSMSICETVRNMSTFKNIGLLKRTFENLQSYIILPGSRLFCHEERYH